VGLGNCEWSKMLQGRTLQWGKTKEMAGNVGVLTGLIGETVHILMYLNLAFYTEIIMYTHSLSSSNIIKNQQAIVTL